MPLRLSKLLQGNTQTTWHKQHGGSESPRGVPVIVMKGVPMIPLICMERVVFTSSGCIIHLSSASTMVFITCTSLSLLTVSNALLMSMPSN